MQVEANRMGSTCDTRITNPPSNLLAFQALPALSTLTLILKVPTQMIDGQSDCDGVEPAPAVASINGYPIGVQQQLNTAMANWAFGAPGVGDGLVAAALPELRVAKFFRGYGWHVGTATQDDQGTNVYQVVYDDGDVRGHHRTEIAQMKSDFQDGCHLQH